YFIAFIYLIMDTFIMQNKNNTASTQTSSELKSSKTDHLDKKIEQFSSSTVKASLFTNFTNKNLSHTTLFSYLSLPEIRRSAPTSRFFSAGADDQWLSLVKAKFTAFPVPRTRFETYKKMYDRLNGWDGDIQALKKAKPDSRDREAIELWE